MRGFGFMRGWDRVIWAALEGGWGMISIKFAVENPMNSEKTATNNLLLIEGIMHGGQEIWRFSQAGELSVCNALRGL